VGFPESSETIHLSPVAPSSFRLHVGRQVPVIILVRTDHDQFKRIGIGHTVGQKILRGVDLEFVDEDPAEFSALLLSDGWVLGDLPDLSVQDLLFLFAEASDPLLEGAGLDDSHGVSPKLVFRGLALVQFLNPDQDILDQAVGQVGVLLGALPDARPVFDLARH